MIVIPLNNSNTLNNDLLEPLKDRNIIIQNEEDVSRFEKFSNELADLEDFLKIQKIYK